MNIVINLQASTNARVFSKNKNEIIHRREFDKVLDWITVKRKAIKTNDGKEFPRSRKSVTCGYK